MPCRWVTCSRPRGGYEQTNIDYYEVVQLVGFQTIEYRQIAGQSEATGDMQGVSVPAPGHYIGEAKRARVSTYGNRDSIRVSSCAIASKMTAHTVGGVRCYPASSWTAYG